MTITDAELAGLDPERGDRSWWALLARRMAGTFMVDPWGFDPDLTQALAPLAHLRWRTDVEGAEFVPEVGGALCVHVHRADPLDTLLVAAALSDASGRPCRFAGVPDVAPVGPLLRRLGGVPSGVDDLRALLRAGEVVAVGAGFDPRHPFGVGRVPEGSLRVALAAGAPVVPVAVRGLVPARHRRLVVGDPVPTRGRRAVTRPGELATVLTERLGQVDDALRL
jgi:1-acyl-sn-glycerol-3-phosphate acyltransferase